jgi:hypothetical protein
MKNDLTHAATMLPLHHNKEVLTDLENFTKRLNQAVPPGTTQKTPDGKAEYLPIDLIENMLREDFAGLVQMSVVSERRELNEYIVHARIEVFHPVAMMWLKYDGIGVTVIMQDSGATLEAFNNTKKKNALEMNAPKAYSEAIKNAAKKIGKKYGGSLNRKHEDHYEAVYQTEAVREQAVNDAKACTTVEQLNNVWFNYAELQHDKEFRKVVSGIKAQLEKGGGK